MAMAASAMASNRRCYVCGKNEAAAGDSVICHSCEREWPYCYQCGEKPRNVPYKLCTDCYRHHQRGGTSAGGSGRGRSIRQPAIGPSENFLQRLYEKKMEYNTAYRLFKDMWVKGSSPEPLAIFAVSNPTLFQTFQSYAKQLREKDADSTTGYFFHGTSLLCELDTNDSLCDNNNCGVCGIIKRGFDPALRGTNISRFKRFGLGFYLAPNSSKCHDYTQGVEEYGLRAQLLCLVACGTKFETRSDHTTLTTPPRNYDSVYGQGGGTLNYDEVVVYDCKAICPEFVILYKRDGVHKIAQ